jgi:hypothetical protein
MEFIEDFVEKKVYHHLLESKPNDNVLFILSNMGDLKNFDIILKFLRKRFGHVNIKSGLFDEIKNRENIGNLYEFISGLNKDVLKDYKKIIIIPDIFDYSYFLPEILGFISVPNLKIEENLNFVISYYNLDKFIVFNIDNTMDEDVCSSYIDFLETNGVSVILIGDKVKCSDIVNNTKFNPIVIYDNDKPLISDLVRKCQYVVGNIYPNVKNIRYNFILFEEEIKLFKSMV